MIKRLLFGLMLMLLLLPAGSILAIESQDYVLDQPTFNYGSGTASSAGNDLYGTAGPGTYGESADSIAQTGSTQQHPLPTPNVPELESVSGRAMLVKVGRGSNDLFVSLQVELRRQSDGQTQMYDVNGQPATGTASWGTAQAWADGVTIDDLSPGGTYTVRARAKADEATISEWSESATLKLGQAQNPIQSLVGGGLLPESITEPIRAILETPIGQTITAIAENVIVPIIVVATAAQAAVAVGLFGQLILDLLIKLLAGLSPLSQYFVFFKRRKPYGRVVNSKTRQPIGGARVTLLRADTKEVIDTQVTDQTGRFLFTVDERQSYLLRVEAPQFDTLERLHRGNAVNRQVNIGLSLEYNATLLRRRQRIDRLVLILNAWRLPLLVLGTGMWLMLYIRDGGFLVWMGLYYAFAWLLEILIHTQPSPFGIITDQATGQPLSGAVVRIFNTDGRLVLTFVTSANGRFSTLLRSGWYQIKVSHSGYQAAVLPRARFTRRGSLKALSFALKPAA